MLPIPFQQVTCYVHAEAGSVSEQLLKAKVRTPDEMYPQDTFFRN